MIKLEKRDGTYEVFDKNKIINAIYKSTINSKYGIDKNLGKKIADNIENMINENISKPKHNIIEYRIKARNVSQFHQDMFS